VMPPALSYKSKAEREREEKEREEREQEQLEREQRARQEAERLEGERLAAERAVRAATRGAPPGPPALTETPPPAMETAETRRPPKPRGAAMFEEDARGLSREERAGIEMLGAVEEEVAEEEVAEKEEATPVKRLPPRPPKSPDTRPVYAGFILVFTGLAQFIWGLLAMWNSPDAGSGAWSLLLKWSAFAMGFIAASLGLLAIRGGLWSFRKERFDVVKIGAISATVCIWAWYVPWLFGALALVIVHRARHEYYPFYNPAWDEPSWTLPTATTDREGPDEEPVESDVHEGDSLEGDGLDWDEPSTGKGRDAFPG
jgi:hypothetical protein